MAENFQIGETLKNGQTSEATQISSSNETKQTNKNYLKFLQHFKRRQNVDYYLCVVDFRDSHSGLFLVYDGQRIWIHK